MRTHTIFLLRLARSLVSALVLGLTLLPPPPVQAAALGQAIVRSTIGQALNAEIELGSITNVELDSLTVRSAEPEAYAEANLDYSAVVRSLRFSLERKGERNVIRVTSDQAVNEPFLTILFELTTSGNRMMRQYAFLIDPPAINESPVAAPAQRTAQQIAPAPETAGVPTENNTAAAVPQAPAPTTPAALAAEDTARLVRRGDTLARIAKEVRPEGVQLEQVLVAIQRANPGAFDGRNMNRVKSGSVLRMPPADTIQAVDATEARTLVRAQTADFARYRSRIAQLATNQPGTAKAPSANDSDSMAPNIRSNSGKVGVQVVEPGSGSAAEDKLQLSVPGSAATGVGEKLAAASNAGLDKIAADRALAEAKSRVEALEKNLADMQKLLELKNKSLADLQAREIAPPASTFPASRPGEKANVNAPGALSAVTDWLQEPWVLPGGGALAVLLLAFGLLRERRRQQARSVSLGTPAQSRSAASAALLSAAHAGEIENGNSVFHSNFLPSASQLDTNEVDPIAEADVYIAYGRDEQAEEILKDALQNHPERNALRVKLLELYAGRKDAQAFGKQAADLHRLTGGVGEDWLRVGQMGQLLDPGNLLYGAMRSADAPLPAKPDANLKLVSPSAEQAESDSAVLDFDVRMENMLAARAQKNQAATNPKPNSSGLALNDEAKPSLVAPPFASTHPPAPPVDFSLAGISLELVPEPVQPNPHESGSTDLTTKLDLALACQEIGDKEGARELLGEVANGSDASLARKARSLLQQLA